MPRPNLSQDIIEEILSRLPVKSLLRFKCVSKSWKSLISSPSFARMQLERASGTSVVITSTPSRLNLVDYETSFCEVPLDFPPKRQDRRVRIMGSCHGLVAVALEKDKVFLWNPSTGDYKKLPDPCFPSSGLLCFYGFGYDSSTDDYKLLLGAQTSAWHPISYTFCKEVTVSIFSLRNNSWRMIQFPSANSSIFPFLNLSGSLVNGALHWLKGKNVTVEIQAFDLKTERFSIVPIPDKPQTSFHYLNIGVLGGRLCLTFYNHNFCLNEPPSHHPLEIWVMKDYGVKESWSKFLTVGEKPIIWLMPLCISKGNEVISINEKKDLIRSDAEEAISEKFRICKCDAEIFGGFHLCHAAVCARSLLSPNVQGRNRKRKNMTRGIYP
ncbi:hypothetical protein SCA6_015938 [Theobroma cacao]